MCDNVVGPELQTLLVCEMGGPDIDNSQVPLNVILHAKRNQVGPSP